MQPSHTLVYRGDALVSFHNDARYVVILEILSDSGKVMNYVHPSTFENTSGTDARLLKQFWATDSTSTKNNCSGCPDLLHIRAAPVTNASSAATVQEDCSD
jgi:hypothetical protein